MKHFNNIQYPINKTIAEKSQTNLNQTGSGVADHNPLEENINNKYPIAAKPLTIKHSHNQKDIKLAMGAYVAVTDGEATEYSYLQADTPLENEKYSFVSYNDVAKTIQS